MPEAEYHLRPEVSKHDLDLIRRAPLLYQYRKANPEPPDDEMNFGSLVHLALLQPHLLENSVCYLPSDAPPRPLPSQIKCREEGKAASKSAEERFTFWDDWNEKNAGKFNIKPETMEKVLGIQKSIMENPSTAIYFQGEQLREASLFWERSGTRMENGKRIPWTVECRARLDILRTAEIVDLKTCGDASRGGFSRDMATRRYSHQGEHYLDGARACGYQVQSFVMIAVECHAPYLCAAHALGESSIDVARDENKRDLGIYHKCKESGIWPNIRNHNQPLEAPIYGFDQ
jgi:exodeoxyribonuclease VIII